MKDQRQDAAIYGRLLVLCQTTFVPNQTKMCHLTKQVYTELNYRPFSYYAAKGWTGNDVRR